MLGFTALGCVLLPCTLWAAAALYFDMRVPWLRAPLAVAYLVAMLGLWMLVKGRWRKLVQEEVEETRGSERGVMK